MLKYAVCLLLLSMVLGWSSVAAQQDSLVKELAPVIVRDHHVRDRIISESMNVQVVSRNYLQRHLGGSLMQSLDRLPGVKTIGIGSGQSKPLIRGLGFNRVMVVDRGIKHEGQQWGADHGLEIDQFAAGEVEIIKGAASFQYGSDAIGGAINILPPSPPSFKGWRASVETIGKSNNRSIGQSIQLQGSFDKWFFDARMTWQSYGDYRVPTDTVHIYNFPVRLHKRMLRNTAGRELATHFTAGYHEGNFSNTIYVSRTRMDAGFFANAHGLEPRRVDTELHDASQRDLQMPRQAVEHVKVINHSHLALGKVELQADLGYQFNYRDEFNHYIPHGYMPPVYPEAMTIPRTLERGYRKHVFTANLKSIIALGTNTVVLGVNAEHQDNAIRGFGFLVPGFTQLMGGIYIYDKFQLNEKLLFHAALRYDLAKIDMQPYTDWFPTSVEASGGTSYLSRARALTRNFNSLVWSTGLNYNAMPFTVKFNMGTSFRLPIAKELAANGVNYHYFSYERGNSRLDPERSYQADLGVRFERNGWDISVSPFFNYFSNYIYLNPTAYHDYQYGAGNQIYEYVQSEVMRYGGEVQVGYTFNKWFKTTLLGEYLYAIQLSGAKKNYGLPFAPPPSALLNLEFTPKTGRKLNETYISLDMRATAAQNDIVPPEKPTDGYFLFNLQAGSKLQVGRRPVKLGLQVLNIFNIRYMVHTSFYRLIDLPEPGRNIILNVHIPIIIKEKK